MWGPSAEVVGPDAGGTRAVIAPSIEVHTVYATPGQGVAEDGQQLARRDRPQLPRSRGRGAWQAAGGVRVGRVGYVNDLNRSLAAAADVRAVLRKRQRRVETSGAEVVVADLLKCGRLVRGLTCNRQQPERARQQKGPYGPASSCYRFPSRTITLDDGGTASPALRAPTVTRRQRYAAAVNATPVRAA